MATGQMYQVFFSNKFCWNKAKAIYNGLSDCVHANSLHCTETGPQNLKHHTTLCFTEKVYPSLNWLTHQ